MYNPADWLTGQLHHNCMASIYIVHYIIFQLPLKKNKKKKKSSNLIHGEYIV